MEPKVERRQEIPNITPSMRDMSMGLSELMYAQEKGAVMAGVLATKRAEREPYNLLRHIVSTTYKDLKRMHDGNKASEPLQEWQRTYVELFPEGSDGTIVIRPGTVGHGRNGWSISITEKGNFEFGADALGNSPKQKEIPFGTTEYAFTYFETTRWLRKNLGKRVRRMQEQKTK